MKLTGQQLFESGKTCCSWEELAENGQANFEAAAKVLSEQLHLEELAQLLIDYRAALETVYKMYMMPDGQVILDILAERGAQLGLWSSTESAEGNSNE